MSFFKKRETVTQNIAYLALMAAINVIFVLLTAIFQPLMFIMIFVLPLTSTVVTLFCKKRYFPIYFIVTISLCLLVTSWASIFDTFFYVMPSLISGFIFGLLIEKDVPSIYILSASVVVQYVITYLTFIILNNIVIGINFIDALLVMFGLGEFIFKDYFIHVFLFLLAMIQTIITYVVITSEIGKLGFNINLTMRYEFLMIIVNLVLEILALIMIFVYGPLTYIFMFIDLMFVIYQFISLLMSNKKINIILSIVFVFSGFIFYIAFNQQIPHPLEFAVFLVSFTLISSLYFANYLFIKKTKSTKIE